MIQTKGASLLVLLLAGTALGGCPEIDRMPVRLKEALVDVSRGFAV